MNDYKLPVYPTIDFIVKWGFWLSNLFAALIIIISICYAGLGGSVWWLISGPVLALVVWGVSNSYIEVLRIISDTLMPR